MAVDDHGLEVLKKSGEEVVPGSKADYYIKVGGLPSGSPGSISPIPVLLSAIGSTSNVFGQITSLASGSNTTIVSYTVPVGKTFFMQNCEASGSNLGEYTVVVGGVIQALRRTFWGDNFNVNFKFDDANGRGLSVAAGTVIAIKVIHQSAAVGDFDARILGVEA